MRAPLAAFAAALLAAVLPQAPLAGAEQRAVYRASGADAKLFDQYDNEGFALRVRPSSDGSATLEVRVSDAPLGSAAPFPPRAKRDASILPSGERDSFARKLAAGSRSQQEAVRRILLGVASEIRYDSDRLRLQDPAAVFASRRAYCVGFAELAVDLLRRSGIPARTVQGVLRTDPGADRYEGTIGGVYHRWIEIFYPDRGYVFSDPMRSIDTVDANYIPFGKRAFSRPRDLRIAPISLEGSLRHDSVQAGDKTLHLRISN